MLKFKQFLIENFDNSYYHVGPKNLSQIEPSSKRLGYIKSIIAHRKTWGRVTCGIKDLKAALIHPTLIHMHDTENEARKYLGKDKTRSIYKISLDKKHVKRDKIYHDHPVTKSTISKDFEELK